MEMRTPNKRPGADAGWRVLFAFRCPRSRAAQAERWAARTFMRIFLLILLTAVAVGCAPTASTSSTASRSGALDKGRVLAIARAAVATNDTWIDRADFETPLRQSDRSWSVTVWRRPATPGGFRVITIDADGTLKDYFRGY